MWLNSASHYAISFRDIQMKEKIVTSQEIFTHIYKRDIASIKAAWHAIVFNLVKFITQYSLVIFLTFLS